MKWVSCRAILVVLPVLAGLPGIATAAVGRTEGSFTVSPTGAGTYQIPLWLSPGAGGLQPSLVLTYDSQRGSGVVGPGWAMNGLSAISRCNKTAAQNFAPSAVQLNYYDVFCLDGRQLRITSPGAGMYGRAGTTYETELANFTQVIANGTTGNGPTSFTAKTKNGLIYEFGVTDDSRIFSATGVTTPYMWLVNKVSDRAGNNYKITYGPGAAGTTGAAVPTKIEYSRTSVSDPTPINSVSFEYTPKATELPSTTDPGSYAYVAGVLTVNTNLLKKVVVSSSPVGAVRQYVLAYEPTTTTKRLRLKTLTECSTDTSAANCLSATTIGYQEGGFGVSSPGSTVVSGNWLYTGSPDVDGDGRQDLMYIDSGGSKVARGSASGFLPGVPLGVTANVFVAYGDVTHSGKQDIFVSQTGGWTRYEWSGTAFVATPTGITLPANLIRVSMSDVNGDGRIDGTAVTKTYDSTARTYFLKIYTYLNTTQNGILTFAPAIISTVSAPCGPVVATTTLPCDADIRTGQENRSASNAIDWDGDSTTDLAFLTLIPDFLLGESRARIKHLLWNGSGYTTQANGYLDEFDVAGFGNFNDDRCTDTLFSDGSIGISPCVDQNGAFRSAGGVPITTMDWNSDGRTDVLVQNGSNFGVALSTGAGFTPVTNTGIPFSTSGAKNAFVFDYDGDGFHDLGTWGAAGIIVHTHASPAIAPDLATSITDGYGVNVSPQYASTINGGIYTKGSGAQEPERDFQGSMYVVKSLAATSGASNGNAAAYTQTFEYSGGRINVMGRGFSGFDRIRMKDGRNGLVHDVYRHTLFPRTGMVYEDDLLQGDGTPISKMHVESDIATLSDAGNNQRYWPYVKWTTTEVFEVDAPGSSLNGKSITKTKVEPTVYDFTYGNATTVQTTVEDTFQGSATFGQKWYSTVKRTISPDAANWCLELPTRVEVTNSADSVTAVQRTKSFDPDIVNCRVRSETTEPEGGALRIDTTYRYDGFGNVDQVTVTPPAGQGQDVRTTGIYWGTTGRYPEKITNALNQDTTTAWKYALGVRSSVTDPNLLMTQWDFDSFGRITRETRPDKTATSFALSICNSDNSYCGLPGARYRIDTELHQPAPGSETFRTDTQLFDLLDRSIRNVQQLLGSAQSEVTRTFDIYGRLASETIPHAAGTSANDVSFSYDLVGRTVRVRRPKNASLPNSYVETTFSYQGPTTSSTDALNHTNSQHRNPVGQIDQAFDAQQHKTEYGYEAFGNLALVRDSKGNVATVEYNVRGMKTKSIDPDLGEWNYNYFPFGELKQQKDARLQVTNLEYDALSRLKKRTENEGDTIWTWGTDPGGHNVGRLATVEQLVGTTSLYLETYTYDDKARLRTDEIRPGTVGTTTYTYTYNYEDATGQLASAQYPSTPGSQLTVQYGYQNGLLKTVKDGQTTYWQANEINSFGHVTQETLGNGVVTTRTIDAVTGLMSQLTSGVGGGSALQSESYLYDYVGSVTERQKYNLTGVSLTEDFYYDSLNRLESSKLNNVTNLTVTYDEIGNVLSRSDVASGAIYQYALDHKHAVASVGSNTYEYDENGNAKKRNNFAIDWTSYNYPKVINGPSKTLSFSYGPDRQRYKQVYQNGALTETTLYIGAALEIVNINNTVDDYRHYIYANGGVVAIISRKSDGTSATRYLLKDHLGSIATILNSSGVPIVAESFEAFGGRRDAENWNDDCACSTLAQIASITRHGFAGQEMIGGQSMGLIHMNGRVMDSVTGRFLSADPFVQSPFHSQSLNRYSYVENNPLSFTDPSGFLMNPEPGDWPEWDPTPSPPPCWWICGPPGPGPIPTPRPLPPQRPHAPILVSQATPPALPGAAFFPGAFSFDAVYADSPRDENGIPDYATAEDEEGWFWWLLKGRWMHLERLVPSRASFLEGANRIVGPSIDRTPEQELLVTKVADTFEPAAYALSSVTEQYAYEVGKNAALSSIQPRLPIPARIFRGATQGNLNHVTPRPGEAAVSFRDSMSNALPPRGSPPQPVLKPGNNYIEVDTSKLPQGSVVADGDTVVGGQLMPPGHVSVYATPEEIANATVSGGKFPKK